MRIRVISSKIALVLFLFVQPIVLIAQSDTYKNLWNDPEVQERIETGIETHRKGWATINFQDEDGNPLSGVDIDIEQKTHDFLFGSNIFILDGFSTEEDNKRFEEVFVSLFNSATLPFYWNSLEPEKGNLRYEADSKPIYRRPPPDPVLEFTEKHNITPIGHPIVWDQSLYGIPEWLPEDANIREHLINKRIRQLGNRYGDKIPIWDVVNELQRRNPEIIMPHDFAFKTFETTDRYFPKESTLRLNDVTDVWYDHRKEYSTFYLTIQNMLLLGAKIDAIGIQCHLYNTELYKEMLAGKSMQPKQLYSILDTYDDFDKSIHITEITIPTIPDTENGEKTQATVTENLYKLWFSHPNVEVITWWNVADGTAVPSQDKSKGGFLDEDLSPKPSYYVLNNLINNEWKTVITNETAEQQEYKFKGFYGIYQITATHNGETVEKEIHLTKKGKETFKIIFLSQI